MRASGAVQVLAMIGAVAGAGVAAEIPGPPEPGEPTRQDALDMIELAETVLAPVYGPLAEQVVAEYGLTATEGIGIDLGSGPGHLIIELCRRTRGMRWINADINPHFFPYFREMATAAGMEHRVGAEPADAQALPFPDGYADIVVSRGSFHLWGDLDRGLAEIYRVLRPGGVALVGRGFSPNLPVETARRVREQQRQSGRLPGYDVAGVAAELARIARSLGLDDYRVRVPEPRGSEGVNYGVWLEFRRPVSPSSPGEAERVYVAAPVHIVEPRWRDVVAAPLSESPGLQSSTTTVTRADIERQQAETLVEALECVPGAWVETRGRKVKQFVSVRGQKYPYPEYALDGTWQREFHELPYFFSAADVERIEVVRSSAALLKGLSGLTGIVDIVPRQYEQTETSGGLELGTFGTYRLSLAHGGVRERASYSLGLQRGHTDGPADRHAREGMTTLRGQATWRPSPRLSVATNLFHFDGERELARAEPPAATRFRNSQEEFDPFRATLVSVKARLQHRPHHAAELLLSGARRDHTFVNEGTSPHEAAVEEDREWSATAVYSWAVSPRNVLRAGGFYHHWVAPNGKRFYVGRRADVQTFSAVVVDEHRWGGLVADAGLRWVKTHLNEYGGFNIDGSPKGFDGVDPIADAWEPSIWNATAGAAFHPSERISVHLALASGYIRPRPGSLDVDLSEPANERRLKVDVGIRPRHPRLGQLSITGFFVRQDNAIALSGQTETAGGRTMELYLNRDQQQLGIEIEARSVPLARSAGLFLNLTAMRSRSESNGEMKRNRELPEVIAGGGVYGSPSGIDLGVFWKYVSSYESTRFAASAPDGSPDSQSLGGYAGLNATAGSSFGDRSRTRVYLDVRNLTDRKFSTVVGYPDFGRRFSLGLRRVFG